MLERHSLLFAFFAAGLCACSGTPSATSSTPNDAGEVPVTPTPARGQIRGVLTPFQSPSGVAVKSTRLRAELLRTARAAWQAHSAARASAATEEIIPGEIVVRMKAPNLSPGEVLAQVSLEGFTPVYRGQASEYLHLVAFESKSRAAMSTATTRGLVSALSLRAGVHFSEPNFRVHPAAVPDDTYYVRQWHYPAMNLPAAWDVTQGSSSVVVAIVDTGIRAHPDLDARVIQGIDMVSDAANGGDGDGRDDNPRDEGRDQEDGSSSWHGTHVAGTIGAVSNNGIGVAGVDWNAKLLPVRVLGRLGGSSFDVAAGMNWAGGGRVAGVRLNTTPAHVINMSLGSENGPTQQYQDIIDAHVAKGIVFVVAAGNDNVNASVYTPCNQNNVICVGATAFDGTRSSFSNFGANVTVMAPGGEMSKDQNGDRYVDGIVSTLPRQDGTTSPDAVKDRTEVAYGFMEGTSMAAPHVSGLVALMNAVKPGLGFAQVKSILQSTASASSQCTEGCGAGLVNAQGAVVKAKGAVVTGPPTLTVGTGSLSFRETPSSSQPRQSLLVANTGGGTLAVTVKATGPQASAITFPSGASLSVPASGSGQLVIQVDLSTLADGTYEGNALVLTGASGTGTATVALQIQAGLPVLANAVIAFATMDAATDALVVADDALFEVSATSGYRYSASLMPSTGDGYFILATIDDDGDGVYFESGERTGFWRSKDDQEPVPLAAGQTREDVSFALLPYQPLDSTRTPLEL